MTQRGVRRLESPTVRRVSRSSDDLGRASGLSVEHDQDGRFRWSAYGPAGNREGTARSRAEAQAAAEAAELQLTDPSQAPPLCE